MSSACNADAERFRSGAIFVVVSQRTDMRCSSGGWYHLCICFWRDSPSGEGPPRSRGFYITHNYAPQSVGLFWTSDQLVAETST
jgi:hypothetical protein